MPKLDVDFIAIYRRTGIGKTTIAIALAIQYSLVNNRAPIISNIPLTIPGIPTIIVTHVQELLEYLKTHNACIAVIDEMDKSFSSNVSWLEQEREQKLTEVVSNARKYGCIALIATSQGKKKIRNSFRLNCKYVIEPLGTLDFAGCMEYFLWDDVELYEESVRTRYQHAELCASILPLTFIESTFDTRQIVPIEWSVKSNAN